MFVIQVNQSDWKLTYITLTALQDAGFLPTKALNVWLFCKGRWMNCMNHVAWCLTWQCVFIEYMFWHNIGLRISSWWFQIFFICTPNPGKWSNLTISYFSTGLVQPPTRYIWRFSNYSWIFGAWWDSPICFPWRLLFGWIPQGIIWCFTTQCNPSFFRLLMYGAYVYSIKTTSLLKLIYIYFLWHI